MDRLRQYCEERLPIMYQPEEQSWAGLRLHQELKAIQAYGQGLAFEEAQRLLNACGIKEDSAGSSGQDVAH